MKKLLLLLTISLLTISIGHSQCSWSGSSGSSVGNPPCGSFGYRPVGSGTYTYWSACQGDNYSFQTCGTSFDTQLTIYRLSGSWVSIAYNDDNGPLCTGTNASINLLYTGANTTNNLMVVNRYNCQQHDFTGVSAQLRYRNNGPSAPPTPSGAGTSCVSRTLTAAAPPYANVRYYWQISPTGTTTAYGFASTRSVTSTDTWYLRAYNTCSGCWGGASGGAAVTIVPNPTISISGSTATICVGATKTFTASTANGVSCFFQWQRSINGGGYTVVGTNSSSYNTGAVGPGNYSYRCRRICNGSNCSDPYSNVISFTVVADPTVSISGGGSTGACSSLNPSVLTASIGGGTGGASYQWQLNNVNISGATASTYDPPALGPGTYSYRVIHNRTGSGCGQAISNTITFTVDAQPTANNTTSTAALCEGSTRALTGSISGPGTGVFSVQAGTGSITGGNTYNTGALATNQTVTIRYTVTNGLCTSISDRSFTAYAQPTANNTTSTAELCEGSTRALTGSITGPGSGVFTVQAGSGSITGGNTYNTGSIAADEPVTIRYTVTNGPCTSISDRTFTVKAAVTADNTTSTANLCEGSTRALTGTLTGPGVGSFSILAGTGSISGGNTYNTGALTANQTVTIRYTVTNGVCSAFEDISFTAYAQPTAVNSTPTSTMCETGTKILSGSFSGTSGAGTGVWSITAGSGNISGTTYTPGAITANETVTVRYTVTNGACSDFDEVSFNVDAFPTVTSSNATMCAGETRTLTSDVAGATFSGTGVSGTTFTAPTPAGVSGIYTINVQNGTCSNSQNILVYANVSITSSSADMCEGDTRTLTSTGSSGFFIGTGVSGSTFTAPTPVGGSQTFTITYVNPGSPCPNPTQDITVYANPSASNAGNNFEACVNEVTTMAAAAPAIGTGTWTWSPSAPTYVGGTNANTPNAQVVFSAGNLYTGTWTISNGPCASVNDNATVDVFSVANNAFLVSGTSTSAVESCEEGTWTYYANPATPNEYIFGIRKNGNTFTADVTITDLPGNTTYSSTGGAGPDRGTWLIGRYWNAELTSGSIGSSVDIRFFFDPAEITQAQNEANAFLNSTIFATDITPLTFFKTTGTNFNPTSAMIGGDFTFTPTYLSYSVGAIGGVTYVEMTGITSFSGGTGGFSVNDDGATLPVELLYVEASNVNNEYIQLDWATATEINNDGFEVLRSTDGINFERIAWVEGKGNSTETNEYLYEDRSVAKGITYYYQLKQVDFDGEFEYFDIVSARLEGKSDFNIGNIVPNPSKENTTVSVAVQSTSEELMTIQIFNHVGVQVASVTKPISSGVNNLEIEIRDLAAGTYFMNFEGSFGMETRKLVVIK